MRASSTLGRFWARYQEKVSCWDWRWASRASFTAVSSAPSASLASTMMSGVVFMEVKQMACSKVS